jgi:hypothetical protein
MTRNSCVAAISISKLYCFARLFISTMPRGKTTASSETKAPQTVVIKTLPAFEHPPAKPSEASLGVQSQDDIKLGCMRVDCARRGRWMHPQISTDRLVFFTKH